MLEDKNVSFPNSRWKSLHRGLKVVGMNKVEDKYKILMLVDCMAAPWFLASSAEEYHLIQKLNDDLLMRMVAVYGAGKFTKYLSSHFWFSQHVTPLLTVEESTHPQENRTATQRSDFLLSVQQVPSKCQFVLVTDCSSDFRLKRYRICDIRPKRLPDRLQDQGLRQEADVGQVCRNTCRSDLPVRTRTQDQSQDASVRRLGLL